MKALFLAGGKGTNLKPVTTQNVTLRIWQSDLTRSSNRSNLPAHRGRGELVSKNFDIDLPKGEYLLSVRAHSHLEGIRSLSN